MGKQPEPDRVTALLEDEWFDDDDTATTVATTAADTADMFDSDEDLDDGDDDFAAENQPREPPKELLFGGQGTSELTRDAQCKTAILGNKSAMRAPLNDEAGGECKNATHADYDIEERGEESRNANHPDDAMGSNVKPLPMGMSNVKPPSQGMRRPTRPP